MYVRIFREERKQREIVEKFIKSGFTENEKDKLPYKLL